VTRSIRFLFAMLMTALAVAAYGAPGAPGVPLAVDLHQDALTATRSNLPLLLFFTVPDCAYCKVVRRHYLAPLVRGDGGRRYIVREIDISGTDKANALDGKTTTHRELALLLNVRFGPTVMFVDRSGRQLAPPLIGGDTAGMYGAYLEQRLAGAMLELAKTSDNPKEKL